MKTLNILAVILAAVALPAFAADQAYEEADVGAIPIPPDPNALIWDGPAAVPDGPDAILYYDNGPWITHYGTAYMGEDESWLQTNLSMNILGFGHQAPDNRVADQFTVPPGVVWDISNITFFAYQTNSGTSSLITSVNLRIWDGAPGGGGSVVWGDTSTNRLISSSWTVAYRVTDTTTGSATDRPVMANFTSVVVSLGPGTYWLDWQTGGDIAFSGPWAPPITVMGATTTGDGLQSTDGGMTYLPVVDNGTSTPQGFPFIIEGTIRVNNDTCFDAEVITCPPGGGTVRVEGSTLWASNTGPYFCSGVQSHYPEVWYRVTGNGGEITATTCATTSSSLDSELLVFDGSCSSLNCVAANDDDCGNLSTVVWPSTLGTDYYVVVSASPPQEGSSDWDFTLDVTCNTSCQTLGTPTISSVGGASCGGSTSETSPILSWNDIPNESGFRWELRDLFGIVIGSGTTGPNVTTADLGTLPAGNYSARVQAFGDNVNYCDGQWSTSCPFEVQNPCDPLSAPMVTGVGGAACGGSTNAPSPLITWTDVENDSGYRWEVRDLFGLVISSGSTGQNVTSARPGTLAPGGGYTVRVLAIGDGVDYCDSVWSNSCAFEVLAPCETLPTPSITAIGDTSCRGSTFETSPVLAWRDIDNESGYRWEVRTASNQLISSGTTAQNVTSVNVGTLELGNYQARVQAFGDGVIYCESFWSSFCQFEIQEPIGVADFTWWPEQPKQGQRVRFADQATGTPIGWFWDTDDGWSSTAQNPTHAFSSTGDFDVSMMCEYRSGTDTRVWTITVTGTIECGDAVCEGEETAWSCPADCGLPPESTGRAGGSDKRPTVPAAVGGVEGSGGTFWMTEGWVFNPGDSMAEFVFEYTPLGSTEVMTVGPFELEAQEGRYWENLVEELFDTSGNGALWLDAPSPLSFLTRSYNSSSSGTFGQAIAAIRERLSIARGDGRVYLIGLREDSSFRSNLFFQEVDGNWVTLRVELFKGNGDLISQNTVDVGGHSNELKSLRSLGGGGQSSVYATVRVVDGDGRAVIIGSVVDQITGDPTTVDAIHLDQLALKDADGNKLAEDSHHLVAVVAHTEGAENSVWGTRFVIKSPEGTGSQQIRLVYIPEYDRTGVVGDQLERMVTINEGRQIVWEDVMIELFALPPSAKTQGALHVYSPRELLITSRTYNRMAGGGTLGQLIKALSAGDMIDADNVGTIMGMSHNPASRTNVGIAVISEMDTEVELKFFTNFPALLQLGSITRTVEAQGHLQVTKVFEELGLSNAPLPSVHALVKVNEGGSVYVYASSVDNASGDPTTIEATRN